MNIQETDKISFISYGARDLIIGGDEMEKFFGMPIYWLGHSLAKLQEALTPLATVSSIAGPAIDARNNIDYFINWIQGFLLSKAAAKDIAISLIPVIDPNRLQHQPNDIITDEEKTAISVNIYSFQAVLYTEFSQSNIFYISQKRAYDMTVLINQGQNVLSRDTINLLSSSKDEVLNDIREATKCLAFDIPTAVGFHLYRAIEAIIVEEYFPLLNIQPNDWETNKNMGNYIRLLENNNVDVKITAMLRHIKDHYRNPISHPDEFWDSNKAENAFGLATSVINVMVQDIDERRIISALPAP